MRDDSQPDVLIAACQQSARLQHRASRGIPARLRKRWPALAIASLGFAGAAAIGYSGGPLPVAGVVASAFLLVALFKLGEGREEEVAVALAAAGLVDEAREAFQAMLRDGRHAVDQPAIDYWMAVLDRRRGQLDTAMLRIDRAIAGAQARRRVYGRCLWAFQLERVQLLAVLGHLAEARAARDRVEPKRSEAGRLAAITTDLCLSFHEVSTIALPDDLRPWARAIDRSRSAGQAAAYLAWAASLRGDDELAARMMRVAAPAIGGLFLAHSAPDLFTWLRTYERLADG